MRKVKKDKKNGTEELPKKGEKRGLSPVKTLKVLNVAGCLLFYVAVLVFLIGKSDFLFRMEEQTIFIPDSPFFGSFTDRPGGLLFYAAAFLSQFFYHSGSGILILFLLLLLLQWLTFRGCSISENLFLLTLIPGTLLLISLFRIDYVVYILSEPQFPISLFIGFTVAMSALYCFRFFHSLRTKILFIVLWTIVAYPLLGFYALLSTLVMVFREVIRRENNLRDKFLLFLSGIVPTLFVPLICYRLLFDTINSRLIYFYGLPTLDLSLLNKVWIPSLLLFLSPAILLFFSRIKENKRNRIALLTANYLSLAACIPAIFTLTCNDINFHTMLKMERALEEGDYNRIIQIAHESRNHFPVTRTIVMYRNIALFNKGLLLEKSFTYPNESENYNTGTDISGTRIAGPAIYYHFGKINFAYRWCMEAVVQSGPSAYCYKYMAKTALLNGEPELARKYLDALKKTLFHKKWAERYEVCLNNPEKMKENREFETIRTLMQYTGTQPESSLIVETGILNFYNELNGGSPEMLALALHASLVLRNSESFWHKLGVYVSLNQGKRIPTHAQEAAIMYGKIEGKNTAILNLDENIVRRYEDFLALVRRFNREPDQEMTTAFREKYGNTYWYYYFFIKDIETS